MKLTSALMGEKFFGNLQTVRGTVRYSLSPYEQRAFAGALSVGVPNMAWRFRKSFLTVATPMALAYLLYSSAEKEYDRLQRKKPGEFDVAE